MHGYLMVLNTTLAWEVLCVFYLVEISRLVELRNTMSCGNATHGKKDFHEGIQQVTHEIQHGPRM